MLTIILKWNGSPPATFPLNSSLLLHNPQPTSNSSLHHCTKESNQGSYGCLSFPFSQTLAYYPTVYDPLLLLYIPLTPPLNYPLPSLNYPHLLPPTPILLSSNPFPSFSSPTWVVTPLSHSRTHLIASPFLTLLKMDAC